MQEEMKLRLHLFSEEPTKSAHWRKCASRKQVGRELRKDTMQAPEQHSASYLLCRAMFECQIPECEADALETGADESVLQWLVLNPAESIDIVPPVWRRDSMGYVCWTRCSQERMLQLSSFADVLRDDVPVAFLSDRHVRPSSFCASYACAGLLGPGT